MITTIGKGFECVCVWGGGGGGGLSNNSYRHLEILFSHLCFELEAMLKSFFVVQWYSSIVEVFNFVVFTVSQT